MRHGPERRANFPCRLGAAIHCPLAAGNKKDAQKAFRDAAKLDPKVGEADDFCRLLMCDAHDINIVSEFLHKNRWLLAPPPSP